jgi:hypothetical protein
MKIYRMNSYRKTGTSSFTAHRRRAGISNLKKAAGAGDMLTLSAEAMMKFHLEKKSGVRAAQNRRLRDRATRRLVYDMTSEPMDARRRFSKGTGLAQETMRISWP